MTFLSQFALTLLGLLLCAGGVAVLAVLLTWQERAPLPAWHRLRLLGAVLPGTVLLFALLLVALLQLLPWRGPAPAHARN